MRAIDEMESDPFAGDVKPLRGPEWKGRFRKRVGRYRIIFTADRKIGKVAISAILIRSEKTYR
jgi:mRNA-degrading endonuclease RelE of RelBE toxin-antitoxin system